MTTNGEGPLNDGETPDKSSGIRIGNVGAAAGWAAVLALFLVAIFIVVHPLAPPKGADRARYVAIQASRSGSAAVGSSAPDFPFDGVDEGSGRMRSLRAIEGHPVWVNFFATWCPPCKAEMPEIERRYRAHQGDGFLVIGADQQESADLVRKFALAYGLTFPLEIDLGSGALAYNVNSLPTSVFIDSGGIVRGIYRGQMSESQMDAAVKMIHD